MTKNKILTVVFVVMALVSIFSAIGIVRFSILVLKDIETANFYSGNEKAIAKLSQQFANYILCFVVCIANIIVSAFAIFRKTTKN